MKEIKKNELANGRDYKSTSHSERDFKLFKGNLFPEKIFGDADAKNEWNIDSFKSFDTFVHTESYESFKDCSALFLLGRRGTGKTAMIRMLDYEIKNSKTNAYNYSGIVLQEEIFPKLTRALRGEAFVQLTKDEIRDIVKDKWNWIIYTTAMVAVCSKEYKNGDESEEIKLIHKFLKAQNLLPSESDIFSESPLKKALTTLEDELTNIDYNPLKVSMAIVKVTRRLVTTTYKNAFNSLVRYLVKNNKKVIILIDSKETYQYNDSISDSVTSALMECVLDSYSQSSRTNIYSKVAFPSEMYPHFTPENKGKTLGKTHFIMWRYNDIINLIAKRYYKIMKERNELSNGHRYSDFESFEKAKAFLTKYFPPQIKTYSNLDFDTIAYIIGHSQKKPRQLIQLFNIILSLAKKNKISIRNLTEDCIREGTNIKLEILTEEALDIYSRIFPSADEIIRKTFKNSKNILMLKDLHIKLQESSGLLARGSLDRELAERLFLECGLIGIVKNETKYRENKTIITAQFEYQVKDIIAITNNDNLVIHPMFYQPLGILADSNSIIYPMPTEEEMEEMKYL